jgi:mannose-6-phosphate isomerase
MDLLSNPVRDYPWGSTTAIPRLLGIPPTGQPQAELWVGAHERASSSLRRRGTATTLRDLIAADPVGELGSALAPAGRLPFLAKVLAVERPLSLQVHPDREQASRGFQREQAAGTPPDARSFADPSPKPELVYAISDFRALCGFRDPQHLAALLGSVATPALRPVLAALSAGPDPLRAAVETALGTPTDQVRSVTAALSADADRLPEPLRAAAQLAEDFPDDPAVLACLLLNSVQLAPGEVMYTAAGQPHCYLSGVGAEIQANSDNVVRAGLTSKQVDVERVLELVATEPAHPLSVPRRREGVELVYAPPVEEFALGVIGDVPAPAPLSDVPGPALLLCLRGSYAVDDGVPQPLHQGEAGWLRAGRTGVRVAGEGLLLRVTTGR